MTTEICAARPDAPGLWWWSGSASPVEVWVLGWATGNAEEDAALEADWTPEDLRFELPDGQRFAAAEVGGQWRRAAQT